MKNLFVVLITITIFLSSCQQEPTFENAYNLHETTKSYGVSENNVSETFAFFGKDLCIVGEENILDEAITEEFSEAFGLFNLAEVNIDYAKNITEKLYPASTTKILTAYVALKYGKLDDIATVSEAALQLEAGSSVCGLAVGDQVSLEELLYGLMMCSGNDAANAIAELVSGSMDEFMVLMNEEAKKIGALHSHFMNPHGLHDENHYTTVYDLYLIFNEACKNEKFVEIIKAKSYSTNYVNGSGQTIIKDWTPTNQYLTGERATPENLTIIGGKTGTTNAAGYCLVLFSEREGNKPYISIVLKSDSRDHLYMQMTELLEKTSN